METILHIIGWFMIFIIIDYKRKGESVIKTFSLDHLIIFVVTVTGILLATLKLD